MLAHERDRGSQRIIPTAGGVLASSPQTGWQDQHPSQVPPLASPADIGGPAFGGGRARTGQAPLRPSSVPSSLAPSEPVGVALPAELRAMFEPRLGDDLTGVRVHTTGSLADASCAAGAQAMTTGLDIAFTPGRYAPQTAAGRELLAHELVHVVQRHLASSVPGRAVSERGDPAEAEAEALAPQLVANGSRQTVREAPSALVQRQVTSPTSGHPGSAGGTGAFAPARTVSAYITLVREAESRLIAAGMSSIDDRIQVLSGIYYGTDWSLDYDVEKSQMRNTAFQLYTARAGPGTDPRPVLGTSLFNALKRSQDVAVPGIPDVDIGHIIIGMNARSSWTPRNVSVPSQGATGLEITTWVGDLGGAAAQLARDRLRTPSAPATRYFPGASGTDYGADSNLEGDIASYLAGAPAAATSLQALTVPAGGTIADALAVYFGARRAPTDRATRFLQMTGGTFSGACLANRASLESAYAAKFEAFGRWYAGTRYGAGTVAATVSVLPGAAAAVAHEFVNWLLRRVPGAAACGTSTPPPTTQQGGGIVDTARRWLGL